ncbi:MAG: helix-turn-helix domain-containing protein [Erysipelotrichaceae bacterium]
MNNFRSQFTTKRLEKLSPCLIHVAKMQFNKDWDHAHHSHYYTEMFYIVQGSANFVIEEELIELQENDLVILSPNISHLLIRNNESTFKYIAIGVEDILFLKNEAPHVRTDYHVLKKCNPQDILFYLKKIVQETEEHKMYYEEKCQSLLEILFINILNAFNNTLSLTTLHRNNKECDFIKHYIDNHFKDDITLDSLATQTFVNKFYLSHTFKKYIGISPINYMIECRIEKAKDLLITTEYSIEQISSFVGFSSQSYFSQIFKKKTLKSPNQYRKANQLKSKPKNK